MMFALSTCPPRLNGKYVNCSLSAVLALHRAHGISAAATSPQRTCTYVENSASFPTHRRTIYYLVQQRHSTLTCLLSTQWFALIKCPSTFATLSRKCKTNVHLADIEEAKHITYKALPLKISHAPSVAKTGRDRNPPRSCFGCHGRWSVRMLVNSTRGVGVYKLCEAPWYFPFFHLPRKTYAAASAAKISAEPRWCLTTLYSTRTNCY